MATKRKTIEYGFQTVSTELAPNNWRELSAITLYIPESSITFKSVILEWNLRTSSGSLINDQVMGFKLGAGSYDDYTDTTNAAVYSGEAESFLGTNVRDLTSYFTSNWSGTSMTAQCRFKVNNVSNPYICNIGATLFITYEYSDASSTHIKTVRIPLESRNAALAVENTWYSVGTSQIPKLTSSGLLPESSITVRHMFINLLGTEHRPSAAGNDEMLCRIDTGSASYIWLSEQTFYSDCPIHAIYDVTSMDPTSSHNLQVQTSAGGGTNRFANIGGWLTVTYEFDPVATTRVLNSVILPVKTQHGMEGSTSDAAVPYHNFYIPEPGTITLKQSALILQSLWQSPKDYSIGVGTQTPVSWDCTFNTISEHVGQTTLVHRIDSGGAAGSAGVTLSGGENSMYADIYEAGASQWPVGHWRAYTILNYESDKADDGVGAHSHSVLYIISPQVEQVYSAPRVYSKSVDITESNYLITGAMLVYKAQMDNSTDTTMEMLVEYGAGEGQGDGWATVHFSSEPYGNGENRMMTFQGYLDDVFAPYPSHPDDSLMDIETSRNWYIYGFSIAYGTISTWITYSSAAYSVSGSVYGYTGDGSGISVQIYRASDHKHIQDATTAVGGGYTATWYDPNDNLYAAARQDSTHVGRSDNGVAV
jgi:hypothetical protein